MKINGTQIIQGMYVYDKEREYTVGDFVIHSGVIYICTKDSKGNFPPDSPDRFTIYLGDKGRSIDFAEYLDYLDATDGLPAYHKFLEETYKNSLDFLDKTEGINKYISVGMLQAAMSHYLFGPTGKGIIGDFIYYDPEGLRVSQRLSGEDQTFTDPENIISQIMFHPSLNHALIRVSRLLPEINGYVGSPEVSDFSEIDQKSVLLRQYTYLQEGTSSRIRLQELIDPIDGVIWYRSGNMDSGFGSSISDWKCSVGDSRVLKSKVEGIIGVYTSRLKVMKSLETHLRSNFRYRKYQIQGGRPTSILYREENSSEITMTVSELTQSGALLSHQTTINLEDTIDGKIPDYLIGDSLKIVITPGTNGYSLSLQEKDTGGIPGDSWFSDVYYKEYYGLS